MNIGELRKIIEGLPDELPVVECRDGNIASWREEPRITLGTVYKFVNKPNYGDRKPYTVEYCEVYRGCEAQEEYKALIFHTVE